MKVLLDSGHGGKDSGAINASVGAYEKDVAFDLCLRVGAILLEMGHDVVYTKTGDIYVSPSDRLRMIQRENPEVFVSLHLNAAESTEATGVETLYRTSKSLSLARSVHGRIVDVLGLKDRGVKNDVDDLGRKLAVLSDTDVPSILIEVAFISNNSDLAIVQDKRDDVANAIAEGVNQGGSM